jgi:tetratricopeptide (TPR) repeat protein
MLFLQRKYQEAAGEFDKTLAVDPEDLEAHYNLMLCYRGLRDDAQAAREEKLYLRFKADESSRAITGPYKLTHPEDNNESQPIHEHLSVALGQTVGSKQKAEFRSQIRKQKSEDQRRQFSAGSGELQRTMEDESLKGINKVAGGNAPGNGQTRTGATLKGSNISGVAAIRPFQGRESPR